MKPTLKSAAAIALLAAGVLAGRSLHTASAHAGKAPPPRESRSTGNGTAHPQHAANDVEQLRQRLAQARRDPGGHAGELARLGVPALKELAMRAEEEVRSALQAGISPDTRRDLLASVIGELHDRLGTGVLEWAASLEAGPGRQAIFENALLVAVRTDPAAAGPWLEDFRRDYPGQRINMISQAAVAGAISRSAGEFLQVMQDMERLYYSDVLRTGYADDFDFATAAKGLPGTSAYLSHMVVRWAGNDPDEAWAALKAEVDLRDRTKRLKVVSAIAAGAVVKMGESAGAEWGVSRIQELPEDERKAFAESLAYSIRDRDTLIATLGKLEGSARTGFLSAFSYSDIGEDTRLDVMASLPREDLVGMVGQQRAGSRGGISANSHMGQAWMDDARARSDANLAKMSQRFAFTPEELSRIESAELPEE